MYLFLPLRSQQFKLRQVTCKTTDCQNECNKTKLREKSWLPADDRVGSDQYTVHLQDEQALLTQLQCKFCTCMYNHSENSRKKICVLT